MSQNMHQVKQNNKSHEIALDDLKQYFYNWRKNLKKGESLYTEYKITDLTDKEIHTMKQNINNWFAEKWFFKYYNPLLFMLKYTDHNNGFTTMIQYLGN